MGVSIACHHTITIASKVNSPDATVIAGHDKLTRRITVKLAIEVEVLEIFLRLSGEDVTAGFLADGLKWRRSFPRT